MYLDQSKTPARLTATTAAKFPRLALFGLGLAYIVFGLFFRDAWKADDAIGLATILSAINEGGAARLAPYIGDFAVSEQGPLLVWIGSLFELILSPLFALWLDPLDAQITAIRFANLLYFYIVLYGVWYGTYLLARRPECQPLPLPFGGEPHPRDYGRMLADCAVLFLIACFGIVLRMHETSYIPLIMACHALAFYGFVRLLDLPIQGLFFLITGLAGSFFAAGVIGFLPVFLATFILLLSTSYTHQQKRMILIALLVSLIVCGAWLWVIYNTQATWYSDWLRYTQLALSGYGRDFASTLLDLAWFLLPLWPFAIYGLWQWRHHLRAPHILIPLAFVLGNLILLLLHRNSFEAEYAPLVIATAVLAAMAIPTLRRNIINTLDWYSIMVHSLLMIVIWLGWSAFYLGWPSDIQDNITRLVPGFEPSIQWLSLGFALALSVLWILAINWRLRLKPEALWRGIVLFAFGATISWSLIVTLWMPTVNYNRSYNSVAYALASAIDEEIETGACIRGIGLGEGQRALFYIYGQSKLTNDINCEWLLTQTNRKRSIDLEDLYSRLPQQDVYSNGITIWQGSRNSDRHGEVFRLIHAPSNF